MARNEAFWRGLMTPGFDHLTAPDEFNRICGSNGGLKTCHPSGPDLKPVWVKFDLRLDCDHYLFKSEGDTHGRAYAMQRRPEDFQQERADRMGWIPEVLCSPEAIYADKQEEGTFVYVCKTLPGEEFAVVIHAVRSPRWHYFVTGYLVIEPGWSEKKRTRFVTSYPSKSKGPKKRKGPG